MLNVCFGLEPLVHFVVPFVALVLLGVDVRRAFLLSLLALTPDLDALFLVHRSFTHSLIALLAVSTPIFFVIYKFKPKVLKYGFMGFFSVASHIALDLPAGYTPLLWPLYNNSVWVQAELSAHIGSALNLALDLHILTEPIVFEVARSLDAPLFTGSGLVASFVILVPVLARVLDRGVRRAQR
jgi:membrane-bound metal-dependent hydrolase YbcI (DUF457 family)